MKRISARLAGMLAAIGLGTMHSMAYVNNAPFSTALAPNIDDSVFVNENFFRVFTEVPFETQNTLYFTNRGQLIGQPSTSFSVNSGFRFEFIDGDTGIRKPAAVIDNQAGASITGTPFVILNATNILNQGTITGTQSGLVRISGQNVDLHRGVIDMGRGAPSSGYTTSTNFYPATGVDDLHWGVGTNTLNTGTLLTFQGTRATVRSPQYRVQSPNGGFVNQLQFNGPRSWVYQQLVGDATDPTNQVIQAVFVLSGSTNVITDVSFVPGPDPGNSFRTVAVKFSGSETNILTGQKISKQLILTDTLASDTNFFLITNLVTQATYRPGSFDLEWSGRSGASSNAFISTNMFKAYFSPTFTNGSAYSNTVVSANYAGYQAQVFAQVPPVANSGLVQITNFAGRLEIVADKLDLSRARIQSQSLVSVTAKDYRGSKGIAVDAPYVNYDLSSKSDPLNLETLTGASLTRFASGRVTAFSTVFTNFFDLAVTNADTGAVDTKHYETAFHVLMVSSTLDNEAINVAVSSLSLGNTNVTIADAVTVADRLKFTAENVTINGGLTFQNGIRHFGSTNMPNLKTLTNNGLFSINGHMALGTDRSTPLDSYVNRGTNSSFGADIWVKDFQNYGQISDTFGSVHISADSVKFDGASSSVSAGTDVTISAKTIKLRSASITATGGVALSVSDSIVDGGVESPNHITSGLGISIDKIPAGANLGGTTIEVNVAGNTEAYVSWPAANLGATAAGYLNNGAIGKLILGSGVDGVITFAGTGNNQAIYVDYLQIGTTISLALDSYLSFLGDYTLYFADSNLPAEQLDGLLDGHIRWVNTQAGFYSGVDFALPNGGITRVNRALLNSQTIDSNGNGIANAFDPDPFTITPVKVTLSGGNNASATVSWPAVAGGRYRLESSARLDQPDWKTVTTVRNESTQAATLKGSEALSTDGTARFYRVTFVP